MKWQREHGEEFAVPEEILALVKAGKLFDHSWHNDACPKFDTVAETDDAEGYTLFVDHPNPELREISEDLRYLVAFHGKDWERLDNILSTDDLEKAIAAMKLGG